MNLCLHFSSFRHTVYIKILRWPDPPSKELYESTGTYNELTLNRYKSVDLFRRSWWRLHNTTFLRVGGASSWPWLVAAWKQLPSNQCLCKFRHRSSLKRSPILHINLHSTLRNPKVHLYVHRSSQFVPVLSQINLARTLPFVSLRSIKYCPPS